MNTDDEQIMVALRTIYKEIRALRSDVAALSVAHPPTNGPAVAPDSDLDGQYGDEEIKRDPPRWKGAPTAPCRMSQCSPEYLDCLAEFFDFKANSPREGKEKYVTYDRKSAARARGWAARIRARATSAPGGDDL